MEKEKYKLLYIYAVGNVDGAASQAEKTIPYLTDSFDVKILDAREYPMLPVELAKFGTGSVPTYLARRLDAAIMKLNPDVIFLHAFDGSVISRIQSAKTMWHGKLIWRFGANITEHFLVHSAYGEGSTLPITLTNFISEPDLVIAPSAYAGEVAVFFDARKIAYVPPTIDVDSYTPTMYEGKKIISVGRFQQVNDFFVTLNVFRRISTEFPGTSYDMIGSGTYTSLYNNAVAQYGLTNSVRVFSDQPAPYQEKADIAVVPTFTAMGPNTVVLEAMAAGCYTIVTDVPGFAALKSVKRVANMEDFSGWYTALKEAIKDKNSARKVIVKQLKEVEEYDSKRVNRVYPDIIKQTLED